MVNRRYGNQTLWIEVDWNSIRLGSIDIIGSWVAPDSKGRNDGMPGLLNEQIFSSKHWRRVKQTFLIFDSPWNKANTLQKKQTWLLKKPKELTLNSVTARTFGNQSQSKDWVWLKLSSIGFDWPCRYSNHELLLWILITEMMEYRVCWTNRY